MIGSRKNGLIVEDLKKTKRKFIPSRTHQFTPLESISIYLQNNDTAPLGDVFINMKKSEVEIPSHNKMSKEEAFEYLGQILPNFDRYQVHLGDIKKLIKWYGILEEHDLIQEETEEENEAEDSIIDKEIDD